MYVYVESAISFTPTLQFCRCSTITCSEDRRCRGVDAMAADIDWERLWQGDFSQVQQSFHESLEVRCIALSGRGVVTLAPLHAGELLVAERALQVAPEKDLPEILQKQQMELDDIAWKRLDLMCDGNDLAVFSKAVALRAWPGDLGRERSSASSISLRSMRQKVDLNAYRCAPPVSDYAFSEGGTGTGEDQRHSNYGVFPLASLFNHSCAPNMCKVLLADWVFLRAARDIEPFEELTQFYCDIRMPVEMRQKELSELFGFSCACSRCTFELQLEDGDESLELWRRFYSCEVPLVHQRFASELQGLVEAAEAAVLAKLEAKCYMFSTNITWAARGASGYDLWPEGQEPVNWLHYKPGYDTWQIKATGLRSFCGPLSFWYAAGLLTTWFDSDPLLGFHASFVRKEYRPHCDGGCGMDPVPSGKRVASSLLYCNVAEQGGSTIFTQDTTKFTPARGDFLFFAYKSDPDYMSMHAACPVRLWLRSKLRGIKSTATQWYREGVSKDYTWEDVADLGQRDLVLVAGRAMAAMAVKPLTTGRAVVDARPRIIGLGQELGHLSAEDLQASSRHAKRAILAAGAFAFSNSRRRKSRLHLHSAISWQDLVRASFQALRCRKPYPYTKEEDYFRSHPAAKVLATWCHDLELLPSMWAGEPRGYRTRGKLAVGAGRSGIVIGLFKRGTWKVLPVAGCIVNHPRLMMAVQRVQQVLKRLDIRPFDHDGSLHEAESADAVRYLELTLERQSGLVQLAIIWNGSGEQVNPQLEALLQELWASDASNHRFWHSIWVHWRDPDPALLRAIHSKRAEAWQQVRPLGGGSGHVVECLDGLHFAFGPASFQQVNLQVFEKILQEIHYLTGRGLQGYKQLQRAVEEGKASGASWPYQIYLNNAVMTGNITTLRYLVDEVGVKTLNSDCKGYSPLQMAVVWGQLDILVYLLTRGAEPYLWTSKSVVDQTRRRQVRLQASLSKSEEHPDTCNLDPQQILELYEKGKVMLEVLEGVEAYGSYNAWAVRHRNHPLVRRFSWDLGDPEPRLRLAVLRALILANRAILLPSSEREALEPTMEPKGEALTKALGSLGLGHRAHELQDALQVFTVPQLREKQLTREDFDNCLRPVALLSDGEHRRLWRFIMELQDQNQQQKVKSSKSNGAATNAKAALLAMSRPRPVAKAAQESPAGNAERAPKMDGFADGLQLIFNEALPDTAFTLVVSFCYGLRLSRLIHDMKLALMEVLGDIGRNDGRLRILELCSGVGVIGLSLAHAASRCQDLKVSLLSTDVNPNCADLFHENATRTFPEEQDCDVQFSACTAAEALADLGSDGADVLVIDPPRRGLADRRLRQRLEGGEDQAAAICNSGVQAVIYMSCGHDSFMADAERLMTGTNAGAFELKSLCCYDMFPYTPHLEILGIFRRTNDRSQIRRDGRGNTTGQVQTDQGQKLQCQFIIGIEQDRAFNVKQRLLGTRGHHVKLIAQRADCKLRLRGWGSGFKEGPRRRESMDPLMLCISSKNESKHREAVELVQGLVEDVYQQYRSFKDARGEVAPELKVQINHGPRPGSRTRWTT
eukprot:s1294_g6.t7